MAKPKKIIIHNKSDKPDNIILKEHDILKKCEEIEEVLPTFMKSFFVYLKGNVLPLTRLAYIQFFCNYVIQETDRTNASSTKEIALNDFEQIKASDINLFIDYCRSYKVETDRTITVYENENRSLARKKSSLSVLFKHLYREELVTRNITDAFNPIRVPKPGEREIKALQDDEVMRMLDAVSTGSHLTKKEREFWEKTKYRDKAILILFLTYGLRLSELQQLNLSSFHFNRGEFKIYRKRGKESILSLQKKRLTQRQIRELVKKYTSIGLGTSRDAGYSPHKLRATTATSLIGRGNSIYDVQALLDHENVTTTQLYAAHQLNVKRDLIKSFEWDDDLNNKK